MKKKNNIDKKKLSTKKTSIGGQALIEGIMMKGPKKTAMAVRNTEGQMIVEEWQTETVTKNKFFKLPIIRGVFTYIDSMVYGSKCLMRSAEISGLEEAEKELQKEKAAKAEAKRAAKEAKKAKEVKEKSASETSDNISHIPFSEQNDKNESNETNEENEVQNIESEAVLDSIDAVSSENNNTIDANADKGADIGQQAATDNCIASDKKKSGKEKKNSILTASIMIISVILGVGLGMLLFIALPAYACTLLGKIITPVAENRWIRSAVEGIIKIAILVAYMALVSLMKDIKRTFMYHGAEHKTIFCYEKQMELTVENVRMQRRFHPRCGTSFLILMLIVGIFISFFIPPEIPTIARVGLKILILPIIVGIGYELIKIAGKHDNIFTKIISAPGMWLQRITTKEPDDSMIECAIEAVKRVIPNDESDNW